MNQQLHDYIISTLKSGITKDVIKQTLLNAGWKIEEVESEFANIASATNANGLISNIQYREGESETIQKDPKEYQSTISPVQFAEKRKERHPYLKILFLCILLFVIFGGGFIGWTLYNRNNVLNDTISALKDMPLKMANISKYSYLFDTKILINPSSDVKHNANLNQNEIGLADIMGIVSNYFSDNKNNLAQTQTPGKLLIPKSLINNGLNLRISGSYDNTGSNRNYSTLIDFTVQQQQQYITGLSFEFRRVGTTNYFRIIEIPLELMSEFNAFVSEFNAPFFLKQWFSVKDETLVNLRMLLPISDSKNANIFDSESFNQELSKMGDYFEIKNAFLDTSVPGNSYVADISVKTDNITDLIKKSININEDRITTRQEEVYLDMAMKKLSEAKITLWISEKEHYLQKASIVSTSTLEGNTIYFDSMLALTNFDKANITEPTNVVAFDDELKKMVY